MKQFLRARSLVITALVSFPIVAYAEPVADLSTGIKSFSGIVTLFTTTVVKATSTLFLSLALVAFFFGVAQFIWGSRDGDATKAKNGKQFMLWGTIALFIMFSVYGIIKFGQGILFQGQDVTTIKIPSFDFGTFKSSSVGGAAGGGVVSPNLNTGGGVSAAQQAYNNCIGNGQTAAQCQTVYQSAGGAGSGQQNLAQQAYYSCIQTGQATGAECQRAYEQGYGGTGSGAQNAYDICIANGNSHTQCQAAYAAYGGEGVANTGSAAVTGSQTGNVGFDNCITGGGGVNECRRMYPSESSDTSSGASSDTGDSIDAGGGQNFAGGDQSWETSSSESSANQISSQCAEDLIYCDI